MQVELTEQEVANMLYCIVSAIKNEHPEKVMATSASLLPLDQKLKQALKAAKPGAIPTEKKEAKKEAKKA